MGKRYIKKTVSYEKHQKKTKHWVLIAIITGALGVTTIVGASYAVFTSINKGSEMTVTAGNLETTFTEGQVINLTNAYPMEDAEGQTTTPYTFTVKNTGTLNAMYRVSLEEDVANTLPKNKIKYSLQKNGGAWSTPALLSTIITPTIFEENQILNRDATVTYGLRLWVDNIAGNEVQGKLFKAKIVVENVVA